MTNIKTVFISAFIAGQGAAPRQNPQPEPIAVPGKSRGSVKTKEGHNA